MKKERKNDMAIGFKPSRWVVSELQECPSSMTLNPRISLDDINLPCVSELPEPKMFHVEEIEIAQ